MKKYSHLENAEIKSVIKWRNNLQKRVKTVSRIINLKECEGWFLDNKSNLYHKSGQFLKLWGSKHRELVIEK